MMSEAREQPETSRIDTNPAASHPDFMSALVTEHFVLQSAASNTVSEAGARASLYMIALSSSLVALGFASQSPRALVPFAAAVLPAVFLLGLFTVVRLVDTGVENLQFLSAIARVRSYYRTLGPQAPAFFGPWSSVGDDAAEALAMLAVRRRWWLGLFTMASMVAVVNSFVAGAGVALLLVNTLGERRVALAVLCGAAFALALLGGFYRYQDHRYRAFKPPRPPR
jgi:hypothetical protein